MGAFWVFMWPAMASQFVALFYPGWVAFANCLAAVAFSMAFMFMLLARIRAYLTNRRRREAVDEAINAAIKAMLSPASPASQANPSDNDPLEDFLSKVQ